MAVASTNKLCIDTSVLPTDILTLKDYDFFRVVKQLTSESIVELIRIQAINNVRVFLAVPNILDVVHINSSELNRVRGETCFQLKDGTFTVKCGIRVSIQYLRDLFTAKIDECYFNKQPGSIESDSDTSTTSDDNAAISPKRPLMLLSPEQTTAKRGRK